MDEKVNRVEYLKELQEKVPSMDIAAYERELNYEKLDLSLDERARNEALLISEEIKKQIVKAYEVALENKSSEEAIQEITSAIEKDSEELAPELKESIKSFALNVLEDIQSGKVSAEDDLQGLEKGLLKGIQDRSNFLNEEGMNVPLMAWANDESSLPANNKNRDAEKKEYKSKAEIVESLASSRESARWVSSSSMTTKSGIQSRKEANISLSVQAEFLGVGVSAGPTFSFRRVFTAEANLMAEGMSPALLPDGNFDFYVRDMAGNPIKAGGKLQKRYLALWCEVKLEFETDLNSGGSLSVVGMGGSAKVTGRYANSVTLTSRRVMVPEYIDGKTATFSDLAKICSNDFLKARLTSNLTVSDSLNLMMKNVVASLRYSNAKSKCAQDSQCLNWFKKENISLARVQNYPRCVEEKREKFFSCELRGLVGQNCAVFDTKGKRISNGMFEFTCDTGLKCVKVKDAGWFKNWDLFEYAKGECRPINPKTYKAPAAIK